ncbi:MAG: hypothetical protein HUK25_00935 [Treponema sp.]|nr:hypothetical protein [Treponema sp.]
MKKIISFLSFILILLACAGLSFIIVWPLWKFATSNKNLYTFFVLLLISLAAVFFITKKIIFRIRKGKTNE